MEDQGQPQQKLTRPYLKSKQGVAVHICNPSYLESQSRFEMSPGKVSFRPYLKNKTKKHKEVEAASGGW
jgi:hypothetical protein